MFIRNIDQFKKIMIQFGLKKNECFSERITFYAEQQAVLPTEQPLEQPATETPTPQILGGYTFDITARNSSMALVHMFPTNLLISITVPNIFLNVKKVSLRYLDETSHVWKIQQGVHYYANRVDFETNHLTKFALFDVSADHTDIAVQSSVLNGTHNRPQYTDTSYCDCCAFLGVDWGSVLGLCAWWWIIILILLGVTWYYLRRYQKKHEEKMIMEGNEHFFIR